ncbi:DNA-binding response regulator, NarL/FixJ family, contains REC and HTH domains [Nakamurella panacisegetis]|uniref:DNA-binding response regulator, NarL/FixJ family, contains REC and HTH domains n=1 Tax=Nakamurella panacisegetis TaxID=1090615 RepID=A0A1H0T7I9_9ACTN|nr:LuxR C-terminal-related transcriptional regulator [Nakamurella panacisegetis]SDP50013.1 DNA-binding response regulator, NarL/FixJ family, contains REC and HTH domains [Nakamurella panacisegetis]
MPAPIPTYVYADDPILQAGVASQLRMRPEIRVLGPGEIDAAEVAVIVADTLDEEVTRVLRAVQRGGVPRTVLVARVIDDATLVAAAEAGVAGLLRRTEATPDLLVRTVMKVASGGGEIPADLIGRLLGQVGRLQRQVLAPRGLAFSGLSDREAQVLRMVADGHDTAAIAAELCYSQRTVKNVLHDLTTRLQLKNRSHAVAYAVREGLI